jgi:hypothetical protein
MALTGDAQRQHQILNGTAAGATRPEPFTSWPSINATRRSPRPGQAPWRRYDAGRQNHMRTQLERILAAPHLSRDVYEIASKSLN